MVLQAYFIIEVSGLPIIGRHDNYPTDQEIESAILDRFPQGFIYDQFSGDKIYPVAQVKKMYELVKEAPNE